LIIVVGSAIRQKALLEFYKRPTGIDRLETISQKGNQVFLNCRIE
jgi:hypothetical protein